jgi:hypothetical protein
MVREEKKNRLVYRARDRETGRSTEAREAQRHRKEIVANEEVTHVRRGCKGTVKGTMIRE